MGRKPKVEPFRCTHCGRSFQFLVKWCSSCLDHYSADNWTQGKDICDRCHSGDNDAYLKRKKASEARMAKFLEGIKDPANWLDTDAPEKFQAWVNSPEYKDRFK